MRGFDAAWLRDYEAKLAKGRAHAGPIQFTLARPFKLLNELNRMHYHARGRYADTLMGQIDKATKHLGRVEPLERAFVEIERHSVQEPDKDGLEGGVKPLLDCLLVRSSVHPRGMGFVVDDKPACLMTNIRHVPSPTLRGQCTIVRIAAWP